MILAARALVTRATPRLWRRRSEVRLFAQQPLSDFRPTSGVSDTSDPGSDDGSESDVWIIGTPVNDTPEDLSNLIPELRPSSVMKKRGAVRRGMTRGDQDESGLVPKPKRARTGVDSMV